MRTPWSSAVLFAVVQCAALARAAPRALLKGRVWERGTLTPLPQARVESAGASALTDSRGHFSLELPPGESQILVTAPGFDRLVVREAVTAGATREVSYRLTRAASERYRSTVRGDQSSAAGTMTLSGEELHNAPGTGGDPFRTVALLPGVAAPLTLLPYYVVRGGAPGSSGYFLDGMRVPQLFHFLAGGGVVHPRLVDELDFHPGSYDVSFGRYAGGIIDSTTRPARSDGQHAELELRLYDVMALVELHLPNDVRIAAAGHYGFPSYLVNLVDRAVSINYGDYQLRIDWRGLTLEALGSYDSAKLDTSFLDDFRLQFHRVQLRDRERRGRVELEAAIVGGYDEMISVGGSGVRKLSLGWRLLGRARWKIFRLYAGTDGELSRFSASGFASDSTVHHAPDAWGELTGNRDGAVAGAFVEGTVEVFDRRLTLSGGVRFDVYHAALVTVLGLDPRLLVRARLLPWLELKGGIGLYQQPPTFPVAMPGIDTYALQLGLQQAIQGSTSVEATMPLGFTLGVTGYYNRFTNVNDLQLDDLRSFCGGTPPPSLTALPAVLTRQVSGASYGMELLFRRIGRPISGWVAYTLSRSERNYECGLRPADFDQTHVLNVVVQAHLPWKLLIGVHLYVATGRPYTNVNVADPLATVRNGSRLPDFVQLDLRIDREWLFARWALAAFLDVANATASESVLGVQYPHDADGNPILGRSHLAGFRWALPTLGLRGRF